jgi:DNA polymerase III alpha subunit
LIWCYYSGVAKDYLQHLTLTTNCEKNMTLQNSVQVFTSASLGMGYNSAEEIAEQIKTHTDSKFFPLANTGPFNDIYEHDKAAEKYNLIPLYARTFLFSKSEETIVILAKNNNAITWLNRQPDTFDSFTQLEDILLSTNHDDLTVFIPGAWLNNECAYATAETLALHCDVVLLWDVRDDASQHHKALCSWDVIPTLPINYASEDDADAFNSLRSYTLKNRKTLASKAIKPGGCFYTEKEYIDLFSKNIASITASSRTLESIFEECETTPINIHHDTQTPSLPKRYDIKYTELETKAKTALIEFIQRKVLDNDAADVYKKRLASELALTKEKGLAGQFIRALDVFYARGDSLMFLRGRQVNSLIFHLFGMTNIDPVEKNLSEHLYFSKTERLPSPLMRFDFDSTETARENVDLVLSKANEGRYFGAIHVNLISVNTAIRSVAKKPSFEKDINTRRTLNGFAGNISFNERQKPFQELIDKNPDVSRLFEELPQTRLNIEHIVNKPQSFLKHSGLRVVFDNDSPLLAPSFKKERFGNEDKSPSLIGLTSDNLKSVPSFQFNLLGLKSLEHIDAAIKSPSVNIDSISNIPLNESQVFESMKINRLGIFQLESSGISNAFARADIKNVDEIAALFALYRPGAIDSGITDCFIQNREYPIPDALKFNETLERILAESRGVPTFHEQFFDILTLIGGLSPSRAIYWIDNPKRLLDPSGAKELTEELKAEGGASCIAESIVGFIECPIQYAFSKGHALSYAKICYCTAWLRHYYLNEWFHVPVNSAMLRYGNNKEALILALIELGVEIRGVDIENIQSINRFITNGVSWFPTSHSRKINRYQIERLNKKVT